MKWKFTEKEYIYDESLASFLSLTYHLIKLKEIPRVISTENCYVNNLLSTPIFIQTNYKEGNKLLNKITLISKPAKNFIFLAFKSKDKNKELIIFKYIISLLKYGTKLNYMKNKEIVIAFNTLVKQVKLEIHRLNGFLRFEALTNNILYARFSPDNDIIENIAYNFIQKLKEESWIIHDYKRNIIAVYHNKNLNFYYDLIFNFNDLKEDQYGELWKKYFKKISIKERENKKCQKNFMPRRYWQNMLEVKEDL